VDEDLVDRARNLNELRFEGLIDDRELAGCWGMLAGPSITDR
jgi:hypothetical protein